MQSEDTPQGKAGGITLSQFWINYVSEITARIHTFPLPPVDFNPLSATATELRYYGLPARPDEGTEPGLYAFWIRLLGSEFKVVSPQFREDIPAIGISKQEDRAARRDDKFFQPFFHARVGVAPRTEQRASHHTEGSRNWSGAFMVPRYPASFKQIVGGWHVPAPSPPEVIPEDFDAKEPKYVASTWIGLGGHRSCPGSSLPQIGTSQFLTLNKGAPPKTTVKAWWQWWVKNEKYPPVEIMNFDACPGDEILTAVTIESENRVLFHIKNQSSGVFMTFLVFPPVVPILPLGPTAEWIHERPTSILTQKMYPLPHCTDVQFHHCLAKSASANGQADAARTLENARLIRMYEMFPNPHRIAFVSLSEVTSATSLCISYREAGAGCLDHSSRAIQTGLSD
jgi:Peptidase A4 family